MMQDYQFDHFEAVEEMWEDILEGDMLTDEDEVCYHEAAEWEEDEETLTDIKYCPDCDRVLDTHRSF